MSVLIRDKNDNKFYSFIKGAPERIYSNSVLKINHFDEIIKS